uniref:Uncharacterized protein n=1 Tax=Solanum tuberosum TaxID=4113 RepID=M1DG06_SOLTU
MPKASSQGSLTLRQWLRHLGASPAWPRQLHETSYEPWSRPLAMVMVVEVEVARLTVQLVDSTKGSVMVHNGSESSFVMDVKSKQDLDPMLVELKESVLNKSVEAKAAPNLGTLPQAPQPSPQPVVFTTARGRPRGVVLAKEENPPSGIATASWSTRGTTTSGLDHNSWSPS